MNYALHVVGCLVVLPYVGLAAFMLFVQRAAGSKGLLSLLDLLLNAALALINWVGLLVVALWCAILVLGLVPSTQRVGAACLLALAIGSLATIIVVPSTPMEPGQWLFVAPCMLVAAASGWSLLRMGA